jgi:hypothetical protein
MLDDFEDSGAAYSLKEPTTTPLLYQQRAASTETIPKNSQSFHHFSLKFTLQAKLFHPQQLPKTTPCVTLLFHARFAQENICPHSFFAS